ncbi:hypothetical protein VTL71DRAFT_3766 [Oculimacula yallundae]|uniref:Uncharacterized protein n=1 Tax=Oculimacula yallundae TaxID=86028 RepID=A0ABR4C401_9HELO
MTHDYRLAVMLVNKMPGSTQKTPKWKQASQFLLSSRQRNGKQQDQDEISTDAPVHQEPELSNIHSFLLLQSMYTDAFVTLGRLLDFQKST